MNNKEDLIKEILKDSNFNEELIRKLINNKVSKNINNNDNENLTFGQKTADKIASFGGSWKFIIGFTTMLFLWIVVNTIVLSAKAFDPYPFVFLNLVLSCVAALQAPIIMMSQNRQTEKDRMTASNDYLVNLKSELILEKLYEKLNEIEANQIQISKKSEI